MSQLLALEWNGNEARLALAATRGERVVIEEAFSVSLQARQSGESGAEVDVGQRIAAALAARGIGRIDTLVAVGRANIELRQLSLPPAPKDELPELVRFQAMREFNELDEDWLLDFMRIDETAEGSQTVLAAAIGPELVGQIEATCQTIGVKPRRLILRPCAAASLWGRSQADESAQPRLLVDLLSNEADLTVMIRNRVIFLRTISLTSPIGGDPLQSAEQARALLAEIRRTMAAAQNQLGGQRVASIILCGSDEPHAELAKRIEEELATPTELFNPFDGLNLGRQLRRQLPENPGRFAPLLGMALAELEETGHAIDFLHPRRRAKQPSRLRKFVPLAVAVVVLVASFFAYQWMQRTRLENAIHKLAEEAESLDEDIARAAKAKKSLEKIETWAATDVVWLDELRELSEEFPPAKQALLTGLTMLATPPGGKMELQGLVDNPDTLGPLEKSLRDQVHRVETLGEGASESNARYSWKFKSSMSVVRKEQ